MTEHIPESLARMGWDSFFDTPYREADIPGASPYRVTSEFKNAYRISNGDHELPATMSGRMHYTITGSFPGVGDWVLAIPFSDGEQAIIHAVLPRKSKFSRKAAGRDEEQIVASNIDTVFIVNAIDGHNFNLRRIERYLTMAWKSGASPVLVLNKADLCENPSRYISMAEEVTMGIPVHAVSALQNTGVDTLRTYLPEGQTVAFLGSSGVGKSALINALTGSSAQQTGSIREYDNKGRHTTTRRELVLLPKGGMVIDTPGMREIQMWGNENDLHDTFEDIEALSAGCRFRDCTHSGEPGCAVEEALATGELDNGRYRNYLKLQKELRYIAGREDASIREEDDRKWKQISKMAKNLKKHKDKYR